MTLVHYRTGTNQCFQTVGDRTYSTKQFYTNIAVTNLIYSLVEGNTSFPTRFYKKSANGLKIQETEVPVIFTLQEIHDMYFLP